MLELGYTKIHLQGHSLGCTKIIYTYNKLKEENADILKNIKSVILLSLVDIPGVQRAHIGEKNFYEGLTYAKKMEAENKRKDLMPREIFIHPISVSTYLTYFGNDNQELDFAKFADRYYDYKEINNIDVPLFMRWGTIYEFIAQELDQLIPALKEKINNTKLDIDYIAGADHNYHRKEEVLAGQMIKFIEGNKHAIK